MPPPTPLTLLIRACIPKPHYHHLHRQPLRPLHHQNPTTPLRRPYTSPPPPPAKTYTFSDITPLSTHPSRKRLLIDVREPSELAQTGRIPGAYSMPLTSNPDAFYLDTEAFFERFGFERPHAAARSKREVGGKREGADGNPFSTEMKEREADSGLGGDGVDSVAVNEEAGGDGGGEGVEEVIFYCKAGVRSRAAASMAREWEGVKVGQYPEGWVGWERRGGRCER